MKYTYRDECIISGKGDIALLSVLVFFVFITLAVFLINTYQMVFKNSDGSAFFGTYGVLSAFSLAIGIIVYRTISKRRRKALECRRQAMKTGIRCDGRILDAGMEMEMETYEVRDEKDNWETRHTNVPNYWIEVEYCVAGTGEIKRFQADHFVKHMKSFIGCRVDVYVWKKRSQYINGEITQVYIDTYGLD